MATTEQKPNLYSLYNKQYDFDEFQRAADSGVSEYISSLKRGNRNAEQFMQAYSDLMAGIKDGSITFKDGKYVDSRGRYSNNKYYNDKNEAETTRRPSKDYYGLMANYIYKKQLAQNEYTPPKKKEDLEKIKWNGNKSVGQAITKHIFNSDTWNNTYFQGLNQWDEDGKLIGEDKRVPKLKEALQDTRDKFDDIFVDYDDAQKQEAIDYIDQAIKSLDNGIAENDYLDLSKAAGGLDYEKMFANKTVEKPQKNPTQAFTEYISKIYPHANISPTKNIRTKINIPATESKSLETISRAINQMNDNELNTIITRALQDPDAYYKDTRIPKKYIASIAINKLIKDSKLEPIDEDSNVYYMPFTNNDNDATAWVYNKNDLAFNQMSYFKIPQMVKKISNDFRNEYQGLTTLPEYLSSFSSMFQTPSHKRGGVIKAQTGDNTKNWYDKLPTIDEDQIPYQYDTSKLINPFDYGNPWESNKAGNTAITYTPTTVTGNSFNIQTIENNPYYQDFTKWLLTNPNDRINWLKKTDELLPSGSAASFYNGNNLRGRWGNYSNTDNYITHTRTDGLAGARHNIHPANGKRYFYTDIDGNTHYVDTTNINLEDYDIQERTPITDGPITWTNYEILGLKTNPKEKTPETETPKAETLGKKSEIWRRWEKQKGDNNVGKKILDFSTSFIPNAIGLGQLLGTIRSNNERADIIKRSMIPLQKITYEHKIPITGAFSEMQFSNSQAANSRSKGNRWFTSDASLQLGGEHAYNAQAMEQERRGFLADDAEIKRTKAESLKEEKENKARRAETINFNTAARIQNAKELAQLEAARLKQNRLSIDNYTTELKDQLSRMLQEEKTRRDAFKYNVYQQDINEQYSDVLSKVQDKVAEWQAQDENKDKSLSEMPGYYSFLKALSQWRTAKLLGANAKIYGYNYNNKNSNKTAQEIASEFKLLKNGGTLRPSILHMINKTLRNENNT